MRYLVISLHMFDNIPLGLHDTYESALREANENEHRGGPKSIFPLPKADVTDYVDTIIIPYDNDGRPLQCEQIGDRGKSLRVVREDA